MTTACAAAALALRGTGTVFAAGSIAEKSSIGAGNAINFAFADDGIDPVSDTDVEADFDYEQGQFIYDVEFTANNTEYDYWIKASSGAVVKKDVKLLPGAQTTAKEEKKEEAKQETGSNAVKEEIKQITLEEAKNKALTDAGLKAAEVTFTKEKADTEDGVPVYEVEFFKDNTEYDYEINAYSGEILKFDYDAEYYNPSNTISYSNSQSSSTQNLISSDEAKNIALQHANLTDNQVTFIKVSKDYDDGIHIYEVEFHYNNREYNYDINAINGTILSYEQD